MFLLVPTYPGSPGQKAVKRLCLCVCVCVLLHLLYFASLMRLSSKETHIDHVVSNKCDWHVSVSTVCRAVPGIRKKLLRY